MFPIQLASVMHGNTVDIDQNTWDPVIHVDENVLGGFWHKPGSI